jgi:hypothetical protein
MKKMMLFLIVVLGLSTLPTIDHHAMAYSSKKSYSSFSSRSSSSGYRSKMYSTGYRSPSSHVTNSSTSSRSRYYGSPTRSTSHSLLTHTAAFGAGALFGSMFHPFGLGHYGGGPSSLVGVLLDLLIIVIIIAIVRRIFFGRKRY